jgi:hypothetical protein
VKAKLTTCIGRMHQRASCRSPHSAVRFAATNGMLICRSIIRSGFVDRSRNIGSQNLTFQIRSWATWSIFDLYTTLAASLAAIAAVAAFLSPFARSTGIYT